MSQNKLNVHAQEFTMGMQSNNRYHELIKLN